LSAETPSSFSSSAFFSLKAKTGWLQTALLTAAGVILLMLFSSFLNLELPQGLFF